MKKLVKISLVSVFTFFTTVSHAQLEIIDRIVALVDSDVVLASELVRRTNAIVEQISARNQSLPPMDKLRAQVLDRLIVESLQLQMAKRVGVRVSDSELDATLVKVAEDQNMNVESFRAKVTTDGTPWAVFREGVRDEIMLSRVRSGSVSRRINISDKEVDNLLMQINREGESKMQYSLGHILLPLAESASPEEVLKVREKAQKIATELRQGADFQEYAITYSSGDKALSGGNLGWRSLAQLPTLFVGSVKNMKDNDISEPLRSGGGLHILKLIETRGGFERHSVQQTHIRHILFTPDAITDDKAALDKALLIRQRIMDGEDFAELAIEFSDDKASGSLGGDLDWSEPGIFVPAFTEAMDSLKINELSQPIKTEFGYHLMEVLGRRSQDQTEEKKRERAYRILHNRKFEEEAQIWLREMKQQAYIKLIDEQ